MDTNQQAPALHQPSSRRLDRGREADSQAFKSNKASHQVPGSSKGTASIGPRSSEEDAGALGIRTWLQDHFSARQQSWNRWMFEHLSIIPTAQIFDVGSGTGQFWLANSDRLPSGWKITLSDRSPAMLSECRLLLSSFSHPITFMLADAADPPLVYHSIDSLLVIGVLDSLEDIHPALRKLSGLLKPGARFYAATGANDHLQELCEIVRRFDPGVRLGTSGDAFTMENGQSILSGYFNVVNSWEFVDRLEFTDPEPVIAYITSERKVSQVLQSAGFMRLQDHLLKEFEKNATFFVTSHKILFEAYQAIDS